MSQRAAKTFIYHQLGQSLTVLQLNFTQKNRNITVKKSYPAKGESALPATWQTVPNDVNRTLHMNDRKARLIPGMGSEVLQPQREAIKNRD